MSRFVASATGAGKLFCVFLLMTSIASIALPQKRESLHWEQLPSLPDTEGFAGSFAGVSNGALIVAGGANFPGKRPWEGGTKVWYDSVFVLEQPNGKWKTGFKLPRPLGYGVSVTCPQGVVCIGGSDAPGHCADVFSMTWIDGSIRMKAWPKLPKRCANMCGALLNGIIYVAGGTEIPDATNALATFWSLDLSRPEARWQELEPWPGVGRMLATAAVKDGKFFLFGGAGLHAGADRKPVREWLRDAYCFTPAEGWKRIADLPRPVVAAPSPALSVGDRILLCGGDDGTQVLTSPTDHRGFPHTVLAYDTHADQWARAGEMPFGLVSTSCIEWNGRIVIPGGEARPGVRSTQVWSAILH